MFYLRYITHTLQVLNLSTNGELKDVVVIRDVLLIGGDNVVVLGVEEHRVGATDGGGGVELVLVAGELELHVDLVILLPLDGAESATVTDLGETVRGLVHHLLNDDVQVIGRETISVPNGADEAGRHTRHIKRLQRTNIRDGGLIGATESASTEDGGHTSVVLGGVGRAENRVVRDGRERTRVPENLLGEVAHEEVLERGVVVPSCTNLITESTRGIQVINTLVGGVVALTINNVESTGEGTRHILGLGAVDKHGERVLIRSLEEVEPSLTRGIIESLSGDRILDLDDHTGEIHGLTEELSGELLELDVEGHIHGHGGAIECSDILATSSKSITDDLVNVRHLVVLIPK
jgi:hypothetical protein